MTQHFESYSLGVWLTLPDGVVFFASILLHNYQ